MSQQLDEKAIFKVACRIESTDARRDYLDQVCGDRPLLFDRVATLLQMHEEEPGGFLEPPNGGPLATLNMLPIQESVGAKIGPYKLREQIGEGGWGSSTSPSKKSLCAVEWP